MPNDPIQHSISLAQAIQLTTRFQSDRPEDMPMCETFEKTSVLALLQVAGAEKFRIYYGQKENGEVCSVLVAADVDGRDILPPLKENQSGADNTDDDALILDESFRCPYACPPESPLNP